MWKPARIASLNPSFLKANVCVRNGDGNKKRARPSGKRAKKTTPVTRRGKSRLHSLARTRKTHVKMPVIRRFVPGGNHMPNHDCELKIEHSV
jgi:hypothetical protein